MCYHSCVARKDSSIIWSAIVNRWWITRSVLCISKYDIVKNTISFHINLLRCYASHCLKQVHCLALAVIVFCLTIVACDVSVSFSMSVYASFGPVFFCTLEECKALIKPLRFSTRTSTIRHSRDSMRYARGKTGKRPQHSCWSIHSAEILQ